MKSAPWILCDVQMLFGRNGQSLFYLLSGEGVGAITAEDEDLGVTTFLTKTH